MPAPIYQLDSFAEQRFRGNPAAVVVLEQFPGEELMQNIAAENNLAETAFIVKAGNDYHIRWFTPAVEVPLCGHATLASAAVVMERLETHRQSLVFHSASGPLHIRKSAAGYLMDFPARPCKPIGKPDGLDEMLGAEIVEVTSDGFNYLALLGSAQAVRNLKPNIGAIAELDRDGLIVTAPGDQQYDFVSRYFAPAKGIAEDPVTGGAHCALVPYWAEKLGRESFLAYQASKRGGEINCRVMGDRVELGGSVVFYLEGRIEM